ncbi:MAG TPA: hypothetical protein VK775_23605 [Chthoniobacterales bacterium]|nr:hypothetical protein [Chthoniobacterales bacterium]
MNNGRFFTVMPMLQWSVWLSIGLMVSSVWGARGQDVTGGSPGQVIVTQRAIRHVEERHWPDSPAQGAGKFSPGITEESFRQLVGEAVANGRARQNSHGRPGQIYEYDFGHPIGINIDGRPAYRLRVVVNQRNQLITAFPF